MPILKPISGHGSTGGIRRYLEKGGRALARDLFNLSYDERDAGALGEDAKEACAWGAEMDATRAAFGTDAPWRGKPARTFKHFVLSPDPGDDIDLAALRELACSWALRHFGDHEIAIVYHDDNARGIPHAHIVVNNANLRTGYRMQTRHPEDLNRDLQDMARERGLSGLSNGRAPNLPRRRAGGQAQAGPGAAGASTWAVPRRRSCARAATRGSATSAPASRSPRPRRATRRSASASSTPWACTSPTTPPRRGGTTGCSAWPRSRPRRSAASAWGSSTARRCSAGTSSVRAPAVPRTRAPRASARMLAEEKEGGAEEGARKVEEDWGDVDEEAW